jgi:LPXTG-motif cell wall-anchored protein
VPKRPVLRFLLAVSLVLGTLLIGGGAASAESDDYTAQPPAVQPVSVNRPATAAPTAVQGATAKPASDLPVTGTDVITLVAIGGGLVLAGGAVLVSRRRISHA